jgi:hypothetical protein
MIFATIGSYTSVITFIINIFVLLWNAIR